MTSTQLDLEHVLRHIDQHEARVSELRKRISRIRELTLPTVAEEEELLALLRALEVLKVHLGKITAHDHRISEQQLR